MTFYHCFLCFGAGYCILTLYMCVWCDLLFLLLLLYKCDTKLYISIHYLVLLASFFLDISWLLWCFASVWWLFFMNFLSCSNSCTLILWYFLIFWAFHQCQMICLPCFASFHSPIYGVFSLIWFLLMLKVFYINYSIVYLYCLHNLLDFLAHILCEYYWITKIPLLSGLVCLVSFAIFR